MVLVGCGNPEADRALIDATEAGDIESIKQHLAAAADVNATDEVGWTPLHHAIVFNEKNQMKIVELLIDKGADVNARDINGVTPLHSIFTEKLKQREPGTRTGHIVSIAKLLINAGANVNAVANNGATPLDEALESRHIDLKDLLCKHGGKTGAELKAEGK